ncbi:hypothetical protein CVV43_04475 [Candidatus Saccharibacteria bacterium HGW-Saccharibacteria-1]|jgi:hypothetical protein|nr:MAG: hypothetical protein CVV43_04475 [Candidatus Saccharibacteria bacterium HGW-Saccharibacteria-1]
MTIENYIQLIIDHKVEIVALIISLFLIITITKLTIHIINRRHLKNRNMTWLELTPPASINKTPEATEQLFSVIHGMYAARNLKDRLLKRSPILSFEITSTKKSGIRYLIQVENSFSQSLQKAIAAYIPDAKVKEMEIENQAIDYVLDFKETGHYIFPLTLTSSFEQHDPLGYITSSMTKLDESESITMQIVLAPIRLREASKLARNILNNENVLDNSYSSNFAIFQKLSGILSKFLWGVADIVTETYHGSSSSSYKVNSYGQDIKNKQEIATRQKPARTLSAFELELMKSMHSKVTQPLFQTNLRILITSEYSKEYIGGFRSALDGYSIPLYQTLKAKAQLPFLQNYRKRLADLRIPAFTRSSSMILSTDEIASLYHFPSSQISRTDNLITSLSRTLPAPVSLKNNTKFDVVIGENNHHGISTLIGLTEAERQRHLYIIGGTGNGKTTMLQYAIVQDMKNGKGVAVIDPHGDMAETLLENIPEDRIKDVVYFNPDDLDYPIGLNLLELTEGLSGNELLREKDIITESVISVFRKIFSDEDSGGHRIEYILRNTIQTALTIEGCTLFTVFDLLNDGKYRKEILKKLEDKNLINFWKNELGKAGDMQRVKMVAGITSKIGRFLFSASARQILEQPKSTIDFDDIINSGKILICNFSKGLIGEDTSELFGITVLAKLQLASLRRARIKQSERRTFYIYVDEFQNFATTSFVQMLSEARKYKIFMIMAEQSTSQQDEQQMVNIILANVGTVVCFRTGNPQDERSLLPIYSPYISQGEISNLPTFCFYVKISAMQAQEPLSGQTILLDGDGSDVIYRKVIKRSRLLFANKQKAVKEKKGMASVKPKKVTAKKMQGETICEPMIDED